MDCPLHKHRKHLLNIYLPIPGSSREPRVFSNPLGLGGHDSCVSEAGLEAVLGGEARVGQCYNELECLASGGISAGYCPDGPGSNILVSDQNNPQHGDI